MIVPMKKVTLFIYKYHIDESLKALQNLGVLHLRHINPPLSNDINNIESQISQTEKCINILQNLNQSENNSENNSDVNKIIDNTLAYSEKIKTLKSELETLEKDLEWYNTWGPASKDDLEILASKNINISLYSVDKKFLSNIPEDSLVIPIYSDKIKTGIALVSEDPNQKFDIKEIYFPETPYTVVVENIEEYTNQVKNLNNELQQLMTGLPLIEKHLEVLKKNLNFAKAKFGMGNSEEISFLQGFCPENQINDFKIEADNQKWGYILEEPNEDDNPPTLLENKKWVNIIQPVFDFLGTVPGYREFDISKYFLIFFSIYFAMIIGDAGYGFIFMLLSIFAHRKSIKSGTVLPLGIKLLYVVSTTTIIWGGITGNWFGAEQIAAIPLFKSMTIPQLAAFPDVFNDPEITAQASQNRIMFICFILALIQLGLANIMNILKEFPGLKSLGHLGWLGLTGGLFFLVLNLVLGRDLPDLAPIIIGISLGLIIIFGCQEKGDSFSTGLKKGLGGAFTTFLDSISSFSNIISYIRLFAVGMATVAIASSFNGIAAPLMKGFALPAGLLILLIGHSLNIIMGMLSVVVHGIRLNVLEFSGQLGIEWSGYKYNPFSKNQESN